MFYDRPFDDIWQSAQSNNLALTTFSYRPGPGGYLAPISAALPLYSQQPVISDFPPVTLFQANWQTGYAITQFLGIQQRLAENWSLEVQGVSSIDRHLLTTDEINRPFSVPAASAAPNNNSLSYNPLLPVIYYRASQGSSNYDALNLVTRYRTSRYLFYVAWTLESFHRQPERPARRGFLRLEFCEPHAGDFLELNRQYISQQFDSSADRRKLRLRPTSEFPGLLFHLRICPLPGVCVMFWAAGNSRRWRHSAPAFRFRCTPRVHNHTPEERS